MEREKASMEMDNHVAGVHGTGTALTGVSADRGGRDQQAARPTSPDAGRVRVLVIGRAAVCDALVRPALDVLGPRIDLAPDEDAARDWLTGGGYDLIVLLFPLPPGRDGLALCRRVRATDGRVPLVVLDVVGTVDDAVAGLDAGSDIYLLEPIDPGELRARVAALLRRHGRARQRTPPDTHAHPRPDNDRGREERAVDATPMRLAGGIARALGVVWTRRRLDGSGVAPIATSVLGTPAGRAVAVGNRPPAAGR